MVSSTLLAPAAWSACPEADWNAWIRQRRERDYLATPGRAAGSQANDLELIRRIVAAYRRTFSIEHYGNGMWRRMFEERQGGLHRLLMTGAIPEVAKALRNPAGNDLHWGFEHTVSENTKALVASSGERTKLAIFCKEYLITLAESLGVERLDDPETYAAAKPKVGPETNPLLRRLDEALRLKVSFPNPFPDEFGLLTDRGVAGFRAIQALYQANRIRSMSPASVVEIGAGLGRTAHYSTQMGIQDYAIVDLPFASVSQAYFLGRVLGPDRIALDGEQGRKGAIRILSPSTFLDERRPYELFVNVDSMPELPLEVAVTYYKAFRQRGRRFLSINHEAHGHTVHEGLRDLRHTRHPYWMRRGYVEEVFSLGPNA